MIPRQWLALVPGCERDVGDATVVSLGKGTAHRLWRVISAAGDFVVRAPDPALPRMRTTAFQRELELQRAAATADLAPKIIAVSNDQAVMVMEFVHGEHPAAMSLQRPPLLAQLLAILRRLHGVAVPPWPSFDPLIDAKVYAAQVIRAAPQSAALVNRRLQLAESLWRACQSDGRAAVVVHCDLHAENIIVRSRSESPALVLLDWEYAQVGDPLLDFAALCTQYPQVQADVAGFLETLPPGEAITRRRLDAASAVFCLLSWLWWRARATQSDNLESGAVTEAEPEMEAMRALESRVDRLLAQAQC